MVRVLAGVSLAGALVIASANASAKDVAERHNLLLQFEFSMTAANTPFTSWVDGGIGKLRYDDYSEGLTTPRGFAEYRGVLTPTLTANAIIDFVDDASSGLDLTEAYLLWRPVPKSANRVQWRLGAFYPPMSLENSGPGWSSPYTFSSSAANTWIGEEIRVFGAEWSMRRRLGPTGSPHSIRLVAAMFYGNDPAGTLVAVKGWSNHDRQTRLFDTLPLSNGDFLEPFHELDHDPGLYAGLSWQYGKRVQLSATYYDNRADPEAFGSGQWGWDTRFTNVGIKWSGPWGWGALAQWLSGDTVWILGATQAGQIGPPNLVIKTDFQASFLLLTRQFRGQRISLRYDDFEAGSGALLSDDGHTWTLAYRYEATHRLTLGAEWIRISTTPPAWIGNDFRPPADERQLQLRASYRWGTTGR